VDKIYIDCLYGLCAEGACKLPSKLCPSSSSSLICSGHGSCVYDINHRLVEADICTVLNPYCFAKCDCEEGYWGRDCKLSGVEKLDRDKSREEM
jgi:hypothetical protein